ncbi:uncharacterized protein LOC136077987 [Hydra vulgaris]|uniref:Uncharacterized protein LOC136077987 n=1 Tax=Hydra vulgaris TaxID=6087 RepID=A0ABM4BHT5_HYDVU
MLFFYLYKLNLFFPAIMRPKRKFVFYGECKKYLTANFELSQIDIDSNTECNTVCRNGHIFLLFSKNKDSFLKTSQQVTKHFKIKTCKNQVRSLINKSLNWARNFNRAEDSKRFFDFCNKPFLSHISSLPNILLSSGSSDVSHTNMNVLSLLPSGPSTSAGYSQQDVTKHILREKLSPIKQKLKCRLSYLSSRLANSYKERRRKIALLKAELKSLPNQLRVLKQNVKQKEKIIKALRAEIRNLKKLTQKKNYGEQIRRFKAEKKALKLYEKHKLRQLKTKHNATVLTSNRLIASLENDLLQIEEERNVIMPDDEKTYSLQIRMIIYNMLLCNVPTGNIPYLMRKIGLYMGVIVNNIPHRSTVEQMARELGSISDLQAAEWAMHNNNLTLGFNATTQEGVHINSINLTSKDKCLVIALDQLPGGAAFDYESHICTSIDYMAFVYSDFYKSSFNECRNAIIDNISNTISDRVAVNHLTISKVCATWGKNLNELNCHLHPLDTIAVSCRSALQSLESDSCQLFGNDCMAVKIVLTINKMRFIDVKGDPKGFVNFLDENDLPRSIIPRYRGNRLHILFPTCFIFMKHYSEFKNFLTVGTVKCKSLQAILSEAFCNKTAIKEMCVLALFGKLLTGPWMKKFYVSAEDATFDHVSGIQVVKKILLIITNCKSNPAALFRRRTDFLGILLPLTF